MMIQIISMWSEPPAEARGFCKDDFVDQWRQERGSWNSESLPTYSNTTINIRCEMFPDENVAGLLPRLKNVLEAFNDLSHEQCERLSKIVLVERDKLLDEGNPLLTREGRMAARRSTRKKK